MWNKKRLVITILIAIILVVILVVAGYLLFGKKTENNGQATGGPESGAGNQPATQLPSGNGGEDQTPLSEPVATPRQVTEEEKDEQQAQNKARFFIETLGSYSADSRFKNIIDLKSQMTDKMQIWADDFVARNSQTLSAGSEKSTTKVFKIEMVEHAFTRAVLSTETRREVTDANGSKVYGQNAVIVLLKQDGEWRVDSVEWR